MLVSIMGVKLWNQLEENVYKIKAINIFKHIIKNMLIFHMTDTNAEVCQ